MDLWSGSKFSGAMKNGWFEGQGHFQFTSGVIYEGSFHMGEFHGQGKLIYPGQGTFNATWVNGKATDSTFTFEDGLIFSENDWDYLAGDSHLIHGHHLDDLPDIPEETFDTGEGYFDPRTNLVFNYDRTHINQAPSEEDRLWILTHCRQGLKHEK